MNNRGFIKGFIIFLAVIGIIVVALAFIFPGLLWSRDLGIRYTESDYNSIMSKLGYTKDESPTGNYEDYEYVYGDLVNSNIELTSEEVTAFFNYNRPDYYALKNVQVKINDNSIEASATVNVEYVLKELLDGKYTKEALTSEYPAIGIIPDNVNIYMNFSGSVINNNASVNISSLTVQGISVPNNYINSSEATNALSSGLTNMIDRYSDKTGSNFEKIEISGGKIIFIGDIPSSLNRQ